MTLDHERPILECEEAIEKLKEKSRENDRFAEDEITKLSTKLEELRGKIYSNLTPWQRVTICRHPDRPHSSDYIRALCDEFEELYGDRLCRDDSAIIGGLGVIGGQKFVIIGQEKGHNTDERLKRNFGMPHPEGYRKAMRLMRMAEKFNLPVLNLVDTPGAYCGLEAEERGQGWAIANNLHDMARLKTPIIVLIIGEGCSGGALGIGVGDVVAMLEHSYYSVISPEGCASILYKDTTKNTEAAASLRMHAEDLHDFDIIDDIIEEPTGGAHKDPAATFTAVKAYVLEKWEHYKSVDLNSLLEARYDKFRKMGAHHEV